MTQTNPRLDPLWLQASRTAENASDARVEIGLGTQIARVFDDEYQRDLYQPRTDEAVATFQENVRAELRELFHRFEVPNKDDRLIESIWFTLKITDDSAMIIPANLFTALLHRGIAVVPRVAGEDAGCWHWQNQVYWLTEQHRLERTPLERASKCPYVTPDIDYGRIPLLRKDLRCTQARKIRNNLLQDMPLSLQFILEGIGDSLRKQALVQGLAKINDWTLMQLAENAVEFYQLPGKNQVIMSVQRQGRYLFSLEETWRGTLFEGDDRVQIDLRVSVIPLGDTDTDGYGLWSTKGGVGGSISQ